jgi:hypothetical protein
MEMRIVGIDCSTSDKSVAVAVGRLRDGALTIEAPIVCGGAAGPAKDVVLRRIGHDSPVMLAIAPLGWPLAWERPFRNTLRAVHLMFRHTGFFAARLTNSSSVRLVSSHWMLAPIGLHELRTGRWAY